MTKPRNLRIDLIALGLLAVVAILGLALFSYSPADPVMELVAPLNRYFQPDVLVHPQNETVQNACGSWGALMASLLLTTMGVGAYYLVLSLAVLDVLLLLRRRIDAPVVRTFGWTASLVGMTAVAALIVPSWSPGPIIGSGGYLGALGAGLLEMHFATMGSLILAGSLILGGLLLSTDYALMHVAHLVFGTAVRGVSQSRTLVPSRPSRKRTPTTDVSEAELSVRISGVAVEDADDDEDELEDELEGQFEDEEAVAAEAGEVQVIRKGADKPAAGPRVRKPQPKSERQQVMQSLDEASLGGEAEDYQLPALDLLMDGDDVCFDAQAKEVRRKAKILEKTFANFGFNVKVVEIETGPVIAQYEVELEAGLRLSQDHRAGRRPGDRPARAQRADRGAHSGQEHGRHRSAQRRPAGRAAARSDGRDERQESKR